ncbi:hypothetical protein RRG08_045209 [Elysia crispata]|uniref:Uncharacterized protein n=1 Tax=Elysia crispata TaxID=231223 RepID=A0AAE1A227_9GAST|nr:hypothetical protein RRG08_045209 [Elysia crispata]
MIVFSTTIKWFFLNKAGCQARFRVCFERVLRNLFRVKKRPHGYLISVREEGQTPWLMNMSSARASDSKPFVPH